MSSTSSVADGGWTCSRCTLINNRFANICTACGMTKKYEYKNQLDARVSHNDITNSNEKFRNVIDARDGDGDGDDLSTESSDSISTDHSCDDDLLNSSDDIMQAYQQVMCVSSKPQIHSSLFLEPTFPHLSKHFRRENIHIMNTTYAIVSIYF